MLKQRIISQPNLTDWSSKKKNLAKWRKLRRCWKIWHCCSEVSRPRNSVQNKSFEMLSQSTCAICVTAAVALLQRQSRNLLSKCSFLLAVHHKLSGFALSPLRNVTLTSHHKKIRFQCLYYELHLSLRARCWV